MRKIKIELELVFDTDRGGVEVAHDLENGIHDLIRRCYMETGEDLLGYEGPFVRKITSTITDQGEQ